MTIHRHPLTNEAINVSDETLASMRRKLEADSGLDLADMSATSVLMNFNAKMKREALADDE
jgi:hypothetical protein